MQIGPTTVDNNMKVPQEIKNRSMCYAEIPFLGIYPKEMKTGFLRHICTLVSVAALFTIAKYGYNRNACQWGNGKDVVYMCACACVSCHLQQLRICVGLGQMMLGEMSQAETEKYCLISLMCGL